MYKCSKCGSSAVEELKWVDMNTGETNTDENDGTGEFYCRDCGAHTDVTFDKNNYDDEEDFDDDSISAAPHGDGAK